MQAKEFYKADLQKSVKKSGYFSKLTALALSALLLLTITFATVVMAMVDGSELIKEGSDLNISFTSNGEKISFQNKPFIKNNEVYLPLREVFEKIGVMDNENSKIIWNNGEIELCIVYTKDGNDKLNYFAVKIGENGIQTGHEKPVDNTNTLTLVLSLNKAYFPVLKDGVTYVPYGYLNYMLDLGLSERNIFNMTCIADYQDTEILKLREAVRSLVSADEWGVSVSVRNVTPTSLTLTFHQNPDYDLGKLNYKTDYTIERYTDGTWEPLSSLVEESPYSVTYKVSEPNGFATNINWERKYGPLSPGVYRIIKDISLYKTIDDVQTRTYMAEFAVTNFQAHITPQPTWPCESDVITTPFDKEINHMGIRIAAAEGTDVISATYGTVTDTGFDTKFGNYIVIENKSRVKTKYAQLSSLNVKAGDIVNQRDVIGKVGKTGTATGAHLYFEIQIDGICYNPELIY